MLDGDALVSNWRTLARLSGSAATGAAVKANAYGLGAREVVTRLRNAGCQDFFVAHWAEAAEIADLVPPGQISVLNGISGSDVSFARAIEAVPVLNSPAQITIWKAAGGGRCHVMLDSGINRLGVGPEQIDAALFDGLDIDILLSHLASADEDVAWNNTQLVLFTDMMSGVTAKRRSLVNSAGIMLGRDYLFDLTRPGLSLYGGIARSDMAEIIKPVVSLSAKVLQIRQLETGDPAGYNATYKCAMPTRTATLAIGYADGYSTKFSNKGSVTFEGSILPVIGKVSMDVLIVDANSAPQLQEGDFAGIDFDIVAASALTGVPQYELLTNLGLRADRIWR